MHKKFLWNFYIVIVLLSLTATSQTTGYLDTLEQELASDSRSFAEHLTCNLTTRYSYYTDIERETHWTTAQGTSDFGPVRVNIPTVSTRTVGRSRVEGSLCMRCNRKWTRWTAPREPRFSVQKTLETVQISISNCDFDSICRKPSFGAYSEKQKEIWAAWSQRSYGHLSNPRIILQGNSGVGEYIAGLIASAMALDERSEAKQSTQGNPRTYVVSEKASSFCCSVM